MKKFMLKIENGSIVLPSDVLNNSSFKEGTGVTLILNGSAEMRVEVTTAGKHRVFEQEIIYDRTAIETQLKNAGLVQDTNNPDVWLETVKSNSGPAKKGVSKRLRKVNINDFLDDPEALRTFLRKH